MLNENHKNYLKNKLKEISKKNQFRHIETTERKKNNLVMRNNKEYISFSCNDYLSLSWHPKVIKAATNANSKYGIGAGASRLITGSGPLYKKLEKIISDFKKVPASCVFGSGFLANLGVISSLADKEDIIFIDEYSHASTFLGSKLTRSKLIKYKHNDMKDLENKLSKFRKYYKKCLLVTEGVFSMDGDISPIDEITILKKRFNAFFILDDAHGLGVVGDGTGSNSLFKNKGKVDAYIGTLSKAVGSYGGFVSGNKSLIKFLINRCRTQIYTTALPPSAIAASIESLKIIRASQTLHKKPLKSAILFCDLLGLKKPVSPIVPIILKDEVKTLKASKALMKEGFLLGAIRPPTVPEKSSRLRLAFNASHTKKQIIDLAKILERII